MPTRFILLLAVLLTASKQTTARSKKASAVQLQFAFFHFKNDRVRVTVDGKSVFDRTITVARDNARFGLAAVAQIEIPNCSDIIVATKRQRIARRICLTAATKSIVIDGGPPLTIVAKDQYQGED